MEKTGLILEWEYWPREVGGTVGDPIPGKACMKDMTEVINHTAALKTAHGDNLMYVTVTIRVV